MRGGIVARPTTDPWLSAIIPTLNEASVLAASLQSLARADVQIVVADGGSEDATVSIARRYTVDVIRAQRGRALQMNAGASVARGDVLLFVHADTCAPADYVEHIAAALRDPRVVGGRFDVRLDDTALCYRLIGTMINLRSRITRTATGDQGIFVRRRVFQDLGGYPALPLMEDLAFSRMMKDAGTVACLGAAVTTSARRWREHGVLRTVLLMWALRLGYYAGIPPRWLRRASAPARDRER